MNRKEYRLTLESLSAEEFEKFNSDFGGGDKTVEQRIQEYSHDPKHERRICHLLDLPTEDEKTIEASVQSAQAAKQSAKTAKVALILSVIAVIVSIFSAIAALK